jgi:hypothetical protein
VTARAMAPSRALVADIARDIASVSARSSDVGV